jgi:prepilin-type N-terminal cleavage/methylation domain-containing protein
MKRPATSDAGFTLVEAMVALSLLLLLVVTINQTLGLARSISDDADRRMRTRTAESEALHVIRRDLAGLADPSQFESGERDVAGETSTLSGNSRTLRLTSLISDSATAGGHVEIIMAIEESDGVFRLVHERTGSLDDDDGTDFSDQRVLLRSQVPIAWAYLEAGDDDEPGWENEWEEREDLPQAIALRKQGGTMPDDALVLVHPRSAGVIRIETCEEPPCDE